ncbi:DNA-J related protein [Halopseudomonas litoralis]|uniref:DNA-J related protein n=1 Tax=Halopseudomonas litoralis TaxID=797277 RepID=A0A1H1P9P7_9GAMM|nr:DNA-J related domain-containing protein [Halopseudomonas litoralis]SDS07359.1 DNA-J related protein [Halopseudomonas litoralis]
MIKPTAQDLLPTGFDNCVLQLLEANPEGVSEFVLIRHLADVFPESVFAVPGVLRDPLQMFQAHFLLFHSLYRLSDVLAVSQQELSINVLRIALGSRRACHPGVEINDSIRTYYLDWDQWLETSAGDVERLLDQFWQGRRAPVTEREVIWAREFFGLTALDDGGSVKPRYRRLMMRHHPDRGGSTEQGREINKAYLILNRYYQLE